MSKEIKWGTPQTLPIREEEFGAELRGKAMGTCSYRVTDEALFGYAEDSEEADAKVRDITLSMFTTYFVGNFQMAPISHWMMLTPGFTEYAKKTLAETDRGVEYVNVTLQSVTLDEESEDLYKRLLEEKAKREMGLPIENPVEFETAEEKRARLNAEMEAARQKEQEVRAMLNAAGKQAEEQPNTAPANETPALGGLDMKKILTIVVVIIILIVGKFIK